MPYCLRKRKVVAGTQTESHWPCVCRHSINPDHRLVLRLPFDVKCDTPMSASGTTVATSLSEHYGLLFPHIVEAKIIASRFNQICVDGDETDPARRSFLAVGKYFVGFGSSDTALGALVSCTPNALEDRSDAGTLVVFKNTRNIRIRGIVYIDNRITQPTMEDRSIYFGPTVQEASATAGPSTSEHIPSNGMVLDDEGYVKLASVK